MRLCSHRGRGESPKVLPTPVLLTLLACDGGPAPEPPPVTSFLSFRESGPRNLLMISIDTLRKDHLSRYGSQNLTPFLAEKMAEGVPLDDHRSCSN